MLLAQNDSLRDEFPALYADVPPFLALAKEAFGNEPDAVNIWIGDERAVSSMHKDHYEVRAAVPPASMAGIGH